VTTLIALLVGILLAFAFLIWTGKQPDAGSRLYAIGLAVTALIYVVFALIGPRKRTVARAGSSWRSALRRRGLGRLSQVRRPAGRQSLMSKARGYNATFDGAKCLSIPTGVRTDGTYEFYISALGGPGVERHIHGYASVSSGGLMAWGGLSH
jgi:hypothetical protein